MNRLISELQGKKTELAPRIKSLRELRGQFKEIESVYLERKKAWDNVSVGLENSRMQLDNELNEVKDLDSLFNMKHQLLFTPKTIQYILYIHLANAHCSIVFD